MRRLTAVEGPTYLHGAHSLLEVRSGSIGPSPRSSPRATPTTEGARRRRVVESPEGDNGEPTLCSPDSWLHSP